MKKLIKSTEIKDIFARSFGLSAFISFENMYSYNIYT